MVVNHLDIDINDNNRHLGGLNEVIAWLVCECVCGYNENMLPVFDHL